MTSKSVIIRSCVFAAVGFVIQLAIVLLIGFGSRLDFLEPVLTSLLGLLLAAIVFGYFSSKYFRKETATKARSILLGSLVGWLALWVQALFGSSVEYFKDIHAHNALNDYIFKPTFWIIFLGTIPSLLIGAIFGYSAWQSGRKTLP